MKQKLPLWIFILLTIFFLGYQISQRHKIDHFEPFFHSDAQIKLYQTVGFVDNGPGFFGCSWIGKEIDPEHTYFPFDFPWSYKANSPDCQFAYPFLFPWVMHIFYPLTGIDFIGQIPVLMNFLTILLAGLILRNFDISWIGISLATVILYFSSLSHTALQYSEISFANLFLVFSIYCYVMFQKKEMSILSLLSGLAAGFVLVLRPENIFLLLIFYGFVFFSEIESTFIQKMKINKIPSFTIFFILGGLISFSIISLINYVEYGHILGIRGLFVTKELTKFDLVHKWKLIQLAVMGSSMQLGIVTSLPALIFFPAFSLFLSKIDKKSIFAFSSIFSTICLLVFSIYNADGFYASLRFFEGTWILGVIGFFLLFPKEWKVNYKTGIFLFLMMLQIVVGYRYYSKSMKFLNDVSEAQSILYKNLHKTNLPLIHLSSFTAYLTGVYYLEAPVFLAYTDSQLKALLNRLKEKKYAEFAVLYYSGEIPNDPNDTKELSNKKFSSVDLQKKPIKLKERIDKAGFFLDIYEITNESL
jgi:hypothetical protein